MIELARLVDAQAELEAKLEQVDRDQRDAAETVARLSAALVELEKADLAGETVSPASAITSHLFPHRRARQSFS